MHQQHFYCESNELKNTKPDNVIAVHDHLSGVHLCLQKRKTCFRMCCPRWLNSSAGNAPVVYVMMWLKPALSHLHTYLIHISDTRDLQL